MQPPAERLRSCCGESNNIACLAIFKLLTVKHRTINHMIIFDDSICKFYQCSILGLCQGISMFFSICLGKKKNAEVIKFWRILKYVSQNKKNFCSRKKSNVSLYKRVIFFLSQNFQTWFYNADHFYCIIHWCLCCHFILFLFIGKKHRNNVTFPYSYN